MRDEQRSGIYIILIHPMNGVYVGSAVCFQRRWNEHRRKLNGNFHDNIILQNAWNKYGEYAFEFAIVEFVDERAALCEREQAWIDHYAARTDIKHFNVSPVAGSQLGYRHTDDTRRKISEAGMGKKVSMSAIIARLRSRGIPTYRFRDPDGNIHEFDYMPAFCQEHGLSQVSMSHVWCGIQDHHMYWTRADAAIIPRYTFVSPDGAIYQGVINREIFCKEHGLDSSNILKVLRGRLAHSKGWRIYEE